MNPLLVIPSLGFYLPGVTVWLLIFITTALEIGLLWLSHNGTRPFLSIPEAFLLLPLYTLWSAVYAPYNNPTSAYNQVLMLAPLVCTFAGFLIILKINGIWH